MIAKRVIGALPAPAAQRLKEVMGVILVIVLESAKQTVIVTLVLPVRTSNFLKVMSGLDVRKAVKQILPRAQIQNLPFPQMIPATLTTIVF